MARFRGTIRGSGGEASRLGGKDSGLHVTAASWEGAVAVRLYHKDGVDMAQVRLTKHSGAGTDRVLYNGPVSGLPPRKKLPKHEAAMLKEIEQCGGAEIHEAEWKTAESLLKKGAIRSFGHARGPGRAFRRAEALEKTDA